MKSEFLLPEVEKLLWYIQSSLSAYGSVTCFILNGNYMIRNKQDYESRPIILKIVKCHGFRLRNPFERKILNREKNHDLVVFLIFGSRFRQIFVIFLTLERDFNGKILGTTSFKLRI